MDGFIGGSLYTQLLVLHPYKCLTIEDVWVTSMLKISTPKANPNAAGNGFAPLAESFKPQPAFARFAIADA